MNCLTLQHIASRLEQFDTEDTQEALMLISDVIQSIDCYQPGMQTEHALFDTLYSFVNRAIESNELPAAHRIELKSIEAELVGRVAMLRFSLGWMVNSDKQPTKYPTLDSFKIKPEIKLTPEN